MKFKACETLRIVEANEKISKKDMNILVYSADSREDYLVQNYIKRQIVVIHGENFIKKSQPRIETILYFLIYKKDEELYDMYNKTFEAYMESVNHNYDSITGFNLIFMFYIVIARQLLREAVDLKGGK